MMTKMRMRGEISYDLTLPTLLMTIINKRLSCFRIHKSSKGGSEYVMQFDEEIDVLRKHNARQILIAGHKFHNRLIKDVYRIIK